ncbi:gastric triacylglycerol lipase-like [Trichosurus vulpecula]|uniref:gastric triacylglycerol lipase-like n=1 Tax=Trichosurus vulpecula TaxID=9337 RepID=UPI00186ADE1D|nr:gastric triacylglycerol lipase-like [Trichosurus vulpecula]
MQCLLTVVSLTFLLGTSHCSLLFHRNMNLEAKMNVSEMITYWGYPSEDYEVMTEDGYILGVYRIPYGKNHTNNSAQRPVVFLQHGLLTSASSWISNLPSNSLAFLLADAGCDVWLGNSRGNTWSRRHSFLSVDSDLFWAFSFDEMATYDLPATIDFIGRKTGQKEMYYVGHSQGTTIAFIAFSTLPRLAQRIKIFFALAPVITIRYTKSPLIKVAHALRALLKVIYGKREFMRNTLFNKFIGTKLCSMKHLDSVCLSFLLLLCGCDFKNLNTSRLDIYLSQNPAGTSVQNIIHWIQDYDSGDFRAFDWGNPDLNRMHFNQSTPPLYTVADMQVPTATWNGGQDLVANPEDIKNLLPQITNLIYHKTIPYYNHLDFIWGINAPWTIYYGIIDMIRKTF